MGFHYILNPPLTFAFNMDLHCLSCVKWELRKKSTDKPTQSHSLICKESENGYSPIFQNSCIVAKLEDRFSHDLYSALTSSQ